MLSSFTFGIAFFFPGGASHSGARRGAGQANEEVTAGTAGGGGNDLALFALSCVPLRQMDTEREMTSDEVIHDTHIAHGGPSLLILALLFCECRG